MFEPSTGKMTLEFPDGCERNSDGRQKDAGPPCQRHVGNTAVVVANASVTARYVEIQPDNYMMNGCDASAQQSGSENVFQQYWWVFVIIFGYLARQFAPHLCACFNMCEGQPTDYRRWSEVRG